MKTRTFLLRRWVSYVEHARVTTNSKADAMRKARTTAKSTPRRSNWKIIKEEPT